MCVEKFIAPSIYILKSIDAEEAPLVHVSARRIKAYEEANKLSKRAHEIMADTTVMQRIGQSRQPAEFVIEVKSKDDDSDYNNATEAHEYYQVDRIINRKITDNVPQYLVHWKGYGEDANSWVSLADFHDYSIIHKYERKIWQQLRQSKKGNKIVRDARRFKRVQQKNNNNSNEPSGSEDGSNSAMQADDSMIGRRHAINADSNYNAACTRKQQLHPARRIQTRATSKQ